MSTKSPRGEHGREQLCSSSIGWNCVGVHSVSSVKYAASLDVGPDSLGLDGGVGGMVLGDAMKDVAFSNSCQFFNIPDPYCGDLMLIFCFNEVRNLFLSNCMNTQFREC